uniref:SSD domain-containing protein n=1 Tax=Angiostrongylus cantonensis TaxID=6313 RepID=A0A0K0DGN1_ANGCA
LAIYNEYFSSQGQPIAIYAFVMAKDDGSMSRLPYMDEAVKTLDFVTANIKHNGQSFFTLCSDFCDINEPIRHFYNGLMMEMNSSGIGERISITFPVMEVIGKEIDLSPNFFGVKTNSSDRTVEFLKLVLFQFRANPPKNWNRYDVQAYERRVVSYFNRLVFSITSNTLVVLTLHRKTNPTRLSIFPCLAIGFVIMSIFSTITVFYSSSKVDQWYNYKIIDAISACVCPLLATSSALGFLFWCGFRFGSILCVTPFLVLAIGVDDAFLMMQSLMHISNGDRKMSKRERVANMLVDVGPSVTITSMTNVMAFLVGYFTPTPEIQLFCIGNAIAILFDFIYQFSVFLEEYSQWLASKFTAISLFAVLACYWLLSIVGTMSIRVALSNDKLVLKDSLLNTVDYILANYTTANIFIQNPGNLNDPKRLAEVNRLIERFESFPECLGSNFSHYFVRDYKLFNEMVEFEEEASFGMDVAAANRSDAFSRSAMQPFFSWPEFRHWNGFVKFDEPSWMKDENKLIKREWWDLYICRRILDSMLPATISAAICTLLCMMLVCFLFMHNLFTVLVASLSILSICIGVFGILSLWGIDLDPISMATTIMSIGFSVDFPAHITFHYFREGLDDPQSKAANRLAKSLSAIGFPLLQCGFSTIIFVLCLLLVKTYMSEVFVKTMVLVVTLGLIHGLILVPAFLCALTSIYDTFFKNSVWSSEVKCSST